MQLQDVRRGGITPAVSTDRSTGLFSQRSAIDVVGVGVHSKASKLPITASRSPTATPLANARPNPESQENRDSRMEVCLMELHIKSVCPESVKYGVEIKA
jgi:hypothetical protein